MKFRFALAWLLALPACAQGRDDFRPEPNSDEKQIVQNCLAASELKADRRKCIGAVAEPCLKTPEGGSTAGMIECDEREIAIWNALLNKTYGEAKTLAKDPTVRSYLKDVQLTWINFRDRACDWPGKLFPDGTIRGPLAGECMLEQTALRAIDLLELKAWLEEH